jgi:hypothetical protein
MEMVASMIVLKVTAIMALLMMQTLSFLVVGSETEKPGPASYTLTAYFLVGVLLSIIIVGVACL